ncbi:D-2-hydroxyacid dehydrogenase family protein [Nakamurella leprariae]|uniref:D-2-hydroxyacid dehydrogenase family protein n=1 Tax=Nakamurella leprariae TaxID=2803911 RepID=UPI0038B3B777
MRVAVLDDYQRVALDIADWMPLGNEVEVVAFADHLADPDAVAERLAAFDAVVLMRERTPLPADLLARLPRLRLIVTTGMQNRSIDLDAAVARGITVCGAELTPTGTVEGIWSLIMAVVRGVPAEDRAVRAGRWQVGLPLELHGSTLGIVGLGRLGARIAAIGQVFGMQVLAWSRSLTDARAAEHGATRVELDELCRRSDVLTVHVPLTEDSRGLIGARELDLLGPDAFLVNTSRGPVVDEAALVLALHEHRIAGAALDVFDTEPLPPDHPLLTTPNTVLSPHLGFVSRQAYAIGYGQAVEDVMAWMMGRPVRVLAGPA